MSQLFKLLPSLAEGLGRGSGFCGEGPLLELYTHSSTHSFRHIISIAHQVDRWGEGEVVVELKLLADDGDRTNQFVLSQEAFASNSETTADYYARGTFDGGQSAEHPFRRSFFHFKFAVGCSRCAVVRN